MENIAVHEHENFVNDQLEEIDKMHNETVDKIEKIYYIKISNSDKDDGIIRNIETKFHGKLAMAMSIQNYQSIQQIEKDFFKSAASFYEKFGSIELHAKSTFYNEAFCEYSKILEQDILDEEIESDWAEMDEVDRWHYIDLISKKLRSTE